MDAQEQKMLEMMQEMLASQAESLRLLTEQIAEKDRINKALEQRVAELSAQLAWFQRQLFGRKSERMLSDQSRLDVRTICFAETMKQRDGCQSSAHSSEHVRNTMSIHVCI